MQSRQPYWGLLCRRSCLLPTWRGWLAGILILGVALWAAGRRASDFLSVNDPCPGGVLVVEGWASDHALEETAAEFSRDHYERLYVTGGPLDKGARLSEYRTHAELGAAILLKLNLSSNVVQAVPAPDVRKDRTFASAVALKRWLAEHHQAVTRINLVTEGPHARRSRLMYEKAFGGGVQIGVIALEPLNYDARHWWRSSAGVRTVIGELLAYGYARLLFFGGEP
jgi:hypothetical protein